jgi:glutathione S-transferase
MKFYDCASAPSPRRARIFMAEKGFEIETVEVDLMNGEHLGDAFKAINPACTVPVLVLDDGTAITENQGIARYLEEIEPVPPLLGRSPKEKALVAMWNARIEFDGLFAVAEAFRNSAKGFVNRGLTGPIDYAQIPALAERGRARVGHFFAMLDDQLAGREFVVGDAFTMADITALVTADFAERVKLPIPVAHRHLGRWLARLRSRPSAAA